jgi:hypothetical protein
MLNYLPSDMDTVVGQQAMLDEFGKGAFSMIIAEGLDNASEARLEDAIRAVDHVDSVIGFGSLTEAGLPA